MKDQGCVEDGEKTTVDFCPYTILNNPVDAKYIYWFDDYIQEYKEAQICDKFPFQCNVFTDTKVKSYKYGLNRIE